MNDHTTIPEKRCTQCGEYFPPTAEYFHRDKSRRDGLNPRCKTCVHEYQTENLSRIRENARKYKAAHPERYREYYRVWRAAHPDRHRENGRAYLAAHPERTRIYKQNRRARECGLPSTFTAEQARFALDYFHNSCAYCGRQFHDLFGERTLAFDHFIPLSSPDCPGTTAGNMVPVCHGVDSCNLSKNACDPETWLIRRFGKRKAREISARIQAYFEVARRSGRNDF